MKKIFLLVFSLAIFSPCFGQNTSVIGPWTSSDAMQDTVSFVRGAYHFDYNEYLSKNYDYVDTSYYWHFYSPDSLKIEYVVRTSRIVKLDKPDTIPVQTYTLVDEPTYYRWKHRRRERKETARALKGSDDVPTEKEKPQKGKATQDSSLVFIEGKQYRILTTRQIVTNIWHIEKGRWKPLPDNLLHITGTTLFNGTYVIVQDPSGEMRLIRR